jgi:hypothetical protein
VVVIALLTADSSEKNVSLVVMHSVVSESLLSFRIVMKEIDDFIILR